MPLTFDWERIAPLVDRDGELGGKSATLWTSSMLATDKLIATQSCQRHKRDFERRKAVGGLLTLVV